MQWLQAQKDKVSMGKPAKTHERRLSFSANSTKKNMLTIMIMFVPM
jgi:hypothetical protein